MSVESNWEKVERRIRETKEEIAKGGLSVQRKFELSLVVVDIALDAGRIALEAISR